MKAEPTVFIVDDDSDARRALAALVCSMSLRTEAFAAAGEFLDACDSSTAGCLLIDVRLSDLDGLPLLDRLRARDVRLPVIMISARADVATAVRAMKTGAVDFLEKPWCEQQLREAVDEAILKDAQQRTRLGRQRTIQRRLARLTEGETEVLDMLVDGRTNREIAEELGLSVRTIEVRRSKLMQKTKAGSLAALVRMSLIGNDRQEKAETG